MTAATVGRRWDPVAFARDFPPERHDALRPRPEAALPLHARGPLGRAWAAGNAVTVDLPRRAASLAALGEAARALAPVVDGVLLRDEVDAPPDAPALAHAVLTLAPFVPVVAVLTCRDRNRVALEGELAALADADAAGVLATAGLAGVGRGVWDVDVLTLTALARRAGRVAAVVAHPGTRPDAVADAVAKGAAGADVCIAAPCPPGVLADFAARLAGAGGPLLVLGMPADDTAPAALRAARGLPGLCGVHLVLPPHGEDVPPGLSALVAEIRELRA